jgi:hypothetical protein
MDHDAIVCIVVAAIVAGLLTWAMCLEEWRWR